LSGDRELHVTIPELAHFPLNPAYGSGAYRRRLVFTAVRDGVVAQVDDTFHSYWLLLDHAAGFVTGIDSGFMRAPTDMCPGASAGLTALIGSSLAADTRELMTRLPQKSNCTHLSDLAVWSLAHVDNSAAWNIVIPDQGQNPSAIEISRGDQVIHRWQVARFEVTSPDPLAGAPLMRGFMNWASATFSGDELLAAIMLQRGFFVARGRQHIVDQGKPVALSRFQGMAGMCWSYSDDRRKKGRGSLGYVRDFSRSVRRGTLPQHVEDRLRKAGS
jgi:hypothetical protein